MIEALSQLIAIPSVTAAPATAQAPYGDEVKRALDYVLSLCAAMGMRIKNCGNHIGYAEIGQGEEMLGILGHLDVVPVGDGWHTDPFTLTEQEGKLYGRGVVDDKGPLIATIFALKDILDSGMPLYRRIRIIFGCQEESGDWLDMDYYKAHEELPTFGFTPDADFPAIYGEKGIVHLTLSMPIEQTGLHMAQGGIAPNVVPDFAQATLANGITFTATGVSAHGSMPDQGKNAISALFAQITAHTTACAFANFYRAIIGDTIDGSLLGIALSDAESGALTCNVGMLTQDATHATITLDIRYPVTHTQESVLARIQQAIVAYPVALAVTHAQNSVFMEVNGAVIQTLIGAYQQVSGDMSAPKVIGGGTYARAMPNIVAFGPMQPNRECTEHQKNEYILREDLFTARTVYRLAIERLAGQVTIG